MNKKLIAEYEAKLATVKKFHPGWRGEDYVAHAEAELAAVKAGGLDGLKAFWESIKNPQPEAQTPDWAVLGPKLAEAIQALLGTFEGVSPKAGVNYAPGVKFTMRPTLEQVLAVQALLPAA